MAIGRTTKMPKSRSMYYSTLFIILMVFGSCTQEGPSVDIPWSFTDQSFPNNNIMLLQDYHVFHVERLNDSSILLKSDFFQGWDKKAMIYTDTLKLVSQQHSIDSNKTHTQMVLYAQTLPHFSFIKLYISAIPNSATSKINFDYFASYFTNRNDFLYYSDHLWHK